MLKSVSLVKVKIVNEISISIKFRFRNEFYFIIVDNIVNLYK